MPKKPVKPSVQAQPRQAVARPKHGVLVGPGAAGLLGWDGFSADDPTCWLVPHSSGTSGPGIIRSRLWRPSDGPTADPALVLAYLLHGLSPLKRSTDDRMPISIADRFELGYEHYLRNGGKPPECHAGRVTPSVLMARQLEAQRGDGEPPTESYLETRTVQRIRTFGYKRVFRQVPLLDARGRIVNRIDLVIPFDPRQQRPTCFADDVGIPIECDGREVHIDTFEKDRQRNNNLVAAGAGPLVVTSTMVEYRFGLLRTQLRALLGY
jgi:hypothetical protein